MATCSSCGDSNLNICGWWFRSHTTSLCPRCAAIAQSQDGDPGDIHVETEVESQRLHAMRQRHRACTCRVCIRDGWSREDIIWTE